MVAGGLVVLQNVTRLFLLCDGGDDDTGDDKASAPRGKSACAKRGLLGRATALASERALNEHRFLSPVHESDAAIEAVLHC